MTVKKVEKKNISERLTWEIPKTGQSWLVGYKMYQTNLYSNGYYEGHDKT
jgi:hypothetical protein